jgi:hypothetical protein
LSKLYDGCVPVPLVPPLLLPLLLLATCADAKRGLEKPYGVKSNDQFASHTIICSIYAIAVRAVRYA